MNQSGFIRTSIYINLLIFQLLSGPLWSQTWFTAFLSEDCTSDDLRPMSVGIYDLFSNKTVLTYMGPGGDPYVSVCDHSNNNSWSQPIKIGNDPDEDSHNYPQIVQTLDGTFHVFYGAHNANIRYAFTPDPHDPYHWKDSILNIAYVAYPMPFVDNEGELYLFYRRQLIGCEDYPCSYKPYPFRPLYYTKSINRGKTWDTPKVAVERWDLGDHMNEIYVGNFTNQPGTDIWHFGWTLAGGDSHDQYHKDLYHALFNTSDDQFYDANKINLGSSIDQSEMEGHCMVLNTGNPYSQYDPGYINVVVANKTEDTLLFNNSYIWSGGRWRDLQPDVEIGNVDEWRDGYFYCYSGTMTVYKSKNGSHWILEDAASFLVRNAGRSQNHVPVTQPGNAAAYLYSKELKGGATDCIMSTAGYKSSGKPQKILPRSEITHLANNHITKITAFLCDEGNMRVFNTPREVTFQIHDGDRGRLIGNPVVQTSDGTAVIYYQADEMDDVVQINAVAAGCKTGTIRITCDQYGHKTEYDVDDLPSQIDEQVIRPVIIYPNPLSDDSYIRCHVIREGVFTFEIISMEGTIQYCSSGIFLTPGENTTPLKINGLKPGAYILVLHSDFERYIQKVVIY